MRRSNRTRRSADPPARSAPAAAAGTLPNTNVAHAEFPLTRADLYPEQRVFIARLGCPSAGAHRGVCVASAHARAPRGAQQPRRESQVRTKRGRRRPGARSAARGPSQQTALSVTARDALPSRLDVGPLQPLRPPLARTNYSLRCRFERGSDTGSRKFLSREKRCRSCVRRRTFARRTGAIVPQRAAPRTAELRCAPGADVMRAPTPAPLSLRRGHGLPVHHATLLLTRGTGTGAASGVCVPPSSHRILPPARLRTRAPARTFCSRRTLCVWLAS